MEDAKLGIFDCVFVKDVSRLARNVVDFLQSVRSLKALGVDCRFITSNMSLSDGELTLTILAAVAQEESANLSKRVKFGKKKNAENGKVPNFVFGYDKIDGDFFKLSINTVEAQIVNQIFKLYTKMRYGTFKIAQILNSEGKTTKRGYPFSQNAVLRILKNRIYIGDIINGKEEVCDFLTGKRQKNDPECWNVRKNAIPPIITLDTFLAAENILQKRQPNLPFQSVQNSEHLFSSLLICRICHSPFRLIVRHYKNTYKKWVCRGRNQNGYAFCENNLVIDESYLFEEIMGYIKTCISDKDIFFKHIKSQFLLIYAQNKPPSNTEELIRKKEEIIKLRQKKLALFEADIISLAEIKIENDKIKRDLDIIEREISKAGKDDSKGILDNIISSLLDEDVLFTPTIFHNGVLRQIIEKIETDPKEISIVFKELG